MTGPPSGPTRVGLVIGQLSAGGAEGQLWLLCRELLRAGAATPIVYCLSDQVEPYRARIEATETVVRVITGNRLGRLTTLRRCLNADRIDVVHAWLFIANAFAWMANVGRHCPLITSARNCKRQGRLLDALNRRAFAASNAIVVNSQEVAGYIERIYNAPRDRIAVIYNAVDTDRFHPAAETEHHPPCVMMIGRLVAQKNPALFLRAAAAIRTQVPATHFRIVGDGPLRAEVESQISALGLRECVEVMRERGDVPELLRQTDVLWLTSDWEGLPNVVLEAMASGVPVVATDVGGTREVLHDREGGFVIPPGDCNALVSRSLPLLTDGALRRRFSVAARARAQAFAPERMASQMLALYQRLIEPSA